jgi:hypothetical protein
MKTSRIVLVMALLAITIVPAAFLGGCSEEKSSNPVASAVTPADNNVNPSDVVETRPGAEPAAAAYPPMCIDLRVPWLSQVPPGDWANTKNCGQAVGVMLGGKFNAGRVSSDVITWENTWLASRLNDGRYRNANGWYTNFSGANALGILLREFHALKYAVYNGRGADDVVNEMAKGRPVIVGVMIKSGRLCSSGGVAHWALAVGYTPGYIYLNDPGTSSGRFIKYAISTFEASWATQGKIYVPVWK